MGIFARSGLSRWITRWFVRAYQLNMDEAEHPLDHYPTLEALFTRRLKPGVRPIADDANAMVSPVDGRVAALGPSTDGTIDLPGGQTLDLGSLFDGQPPERAQAIVIYLSPKDYHRVHTPVNGHVTDWAYIPGTLWPVFPAAVRRVRNLFSRNERALVRIRNTLGDVDVALIGAFGVGRMTLACCDLITNTSGKAQRQTFDAPQACEAGDDLGVFHLGSTVVMMVPDQTWSWTVAENDVVRMGQIIGRY